MEQRYAGTEREDTGAGMANMTFHDVSRRAAPARMTEHDTSGHGPEPIAGPYPPPALAKAGFAPAPDPGPISGPLDLPERCKRSAAEGVPRFREGRPGRRYEDAIFL